MEKQNDNARGRNDHPLSSYRSQVVTPYERGDLKNSSTYIAPRLEHDSIQAYKRLTMNIAQYLRYR